MYTVPSNPSAGDAYNEPDVTKRQIRVPSAVESAYNDLS